MFVNSPSPPRLPGEHFRRSSAHNLSLTTQVFGSLLSVLIILLGTIGNSLVIFVFGWRERKSRTRCSLLFLLLAVTDLSCCLLTGPIQINDMLLAADKFSRFNHEVHTKFLPTMFPTTILVSQGILVMICFDRYRIVSQPFRERHSLKPVWFCYFGLIILGLLLYLPFAIIHFIEDANGTFMDPFILVDSSILELAHAVIDITRDILGLIVMSLLIWMILRSLKKHEKDLSRTFDIKRDRKDSNAIRKTLFVVVAAFVLCTLPFDVFFFSIRVEVMLKDHLPREKRYVYKELMIYLRVLQIGNSCVNFYIYSFLHPAFEHIRFKVRNGFLFVSKCFSKDYRKTSDHQDQPGTPQLQRIQRVMSANDRTSSTETIVSYVNSSL